MFEDMNYLGFSSSSHSYTCYEAFFEDPCNKLLRLYWKLFFKMLGSPDCSFTTLRVYLKNSGNEQQKGWDYDFYDFTGNFLWWCLVPQFQFYDFYEFIWKTLATKCIMDGITTFTTLLETFFEDAWTQKDGAKFQYKK